MSQQTVHLNDNASVKFPDEDLDEYDNPCVLYIRKKFQFYLYNDLEIQNEEISFLIDGIEFRFQGDGCMDVHIGNYIGVRSDIALMQQISNDLLMPISDVFNAVSTWDSNGNCWGYYEISDDGANAIVYDYFRVKCEDYIHSLGLQCHLII